MKTRIDYITSTILILLGVAHSSLTPIFYKEFNQEFLWFAGSGLAFLFLGLLNFARVKHTHNILKIYCTIGNILALIFLVLFFIVEKTVAPQALVSVVVLIVLLMFSISPKRKTST